MKYLSSKIVYCVIFGTCMTILLLSSGCKSSSKADKIKKPDIETIQISNIKGGRNKIVKEALSWVGTPYRYAGSEKGKGTDCSGMVLRVYEDVTGIKLPRNSQRQAEFCKKIKPKEVKPGDLAFFATGKDKKTISHVGIMIDGVQFIHASTKKGVIISDMTTDYYQRTFIMYGRVADKD